MAGFWQSRIASIYKIQYFSFSTYISKIIWTHCVCGLWIKSLLCSPAKTQNNLWALFSYFAVCTIMSLQCEHCHFMPYSDVCVVVPHPHFFSLFNNRWPTVDNLLTTFREGCKDKLLEVYFIQWLKRNIRVGTKFGGDQPSKLCNNLNIFVSKPMFTPLLIGYLDRSFCC